MRISKWLSALLPALLTAALALLTGVFVVQSARADADGGPLMDPTAPQNKVVGPVNAATPATEYRLSGIWRRNGRTIVVINGAPTVVGASIDGARVVSVADESVALRLSDGSAMTLRSSPQVVRRANTSNNPGELATRE